MRMALSQVLLVDDSEVILTFEREALSGHYAISTASNGRQALEQLRRARPAAMLLDLSMPEMGGLEVLQTVRGEPALATMPVIVVSSEDHRRDQCLQAGADEFLAKPVRAPDLLAAVGRVIAASQTRAIRAGLAVLFLRVGDLEFGVPLESVDQVLSEAATIPLAAGPSHLCELVDLHGKAVLVLDTAARLGTRYARSAADRVFVVLEHGGRQFCLRADGVRDPEEIPSDRLVQSADLGGSQAAGLRALLRAVVRTDHGPIPILDAAALVGGEAVDGLNDLIEGGGDRVSS
jgi:CheY-like chemotaxis protein/chemotaxis signal transduction protein